MAHESDPCWSIRGRDELVWRQWDGEFLLYDRISGDIHVLDCVAGVLLEALADSPANQTPLLAHVADTLDVESDSELLSVVQQTLDKLSTLRLVNCQT